MNYCKKIDLVDVILEDLSKLVGYTGMKVEDDLDIISDERSMLLKKMNKLQKKMRSFEKIR
jgi:hypothetical protein